jgi:hypothetical protein
LLQIFQPTGSTSSRYIPASTTPSITGVARSLRSWLQWTMGSAPPAPLPPPPFPLTVVAPPPVVAVAVLAVDDPPLPPVRRGS